MITDVVSVIKLADGNIASCSGYKIKIWSLVTNGVIDTFVGHLGLVTAIVQLSNGNLVSVSQDSIIKIWDLVKSSEIASFKGHTAEISTVIQMRDGRLVTGGWDNLIKIWDLTGQAPLATNLTGKL